MPAQPFEPLLNRDMSKVLPKFVIETVSPLLQETINYATNLYQRCQTSKEGEPDEAYPVLASYLHIIQMTDSIEVLISNGCVQPVSLLLRSSFEASLAVAYMLEKNSRQRAVSWMVKNIIDKIEELENYDPTHPKSAEFKNTIKQTGIGEIASLPAIPNVAENLLKLKESLKKPGYVEAYAEYKTLVNNRRKYPRKYPEWYSFYGGPNNLRELAKHLGKGFIYKTLYASWSRMSHVSDTLHLTLPLEDGTSVLGPIRNPIHIVDIGTMAFSILMEASQLMVNKYRPYEESKFHKWYEKEARDRHHFLSQL